VQLVVADREAAGHASLCVHPLSPSLSFFLLSNCRARGRNGQRRRAARTASTAAPRTRPVSFPPFLTHRARFIRSAAFLSLGAPREGVPRLHCCLRLLGSACAPAPLGPSFLEERIMRTWFRGLRKSTRPQRPSRRLEVESLEQRSLLSATGY